MANQVITHKSIGCLCMKAKNGDDFVYVYCIINKCTWHHYSLGYRNQTKIFKFSMARGVKWCIVFVALRFVYRLLAPWNPVNIFLQHAYFTNIFLFLNVHVCVNYAGFCWDSHDYWSVIFILKTSIHMHNYKSSNSEQLNNAMVNSYCIYKNNFYTFMKIILVHYPHI